MEELVHQPHDKLFRETFTRLKAALSFFQGYFPKTIAKFIDWKSLELQPGSYTDEELKGSESDLLYRVKFKDTKLFIYLLFESQSSHCHLMAYRFSKYRTRIWEQFLKQNPNAKKLPFVFPILLAHQKGGWKATRSFMDLMDIPEDSIELLRPYVPDFKYHLIDLSDIPDEQIKGNIAAKMTQHLFKADMEDHIVESIELLQEFFKQIFKERDAIELLRSYFLYIMTVDSRVDPKEFTRKIKVLKNQTLKEEAMSIAEQLKQEGKVEGELIGQIIAYQKLLHANDYTREALQSQSLEHLEAILAELEKQLDL